MDDDERRFIGDLLSGEDEVFTAAAAVTHQTEGSRHSGRQPNVAPPGGPIAGPPPSGMANYWPEPPPPYSPPLQHFAPTAMHQQPRMPMSPPQAMFPQYYQQQKVRPPNPNSYAEFHSLVTDPSMCFRKQQRVSDYGNMSRPPDLMYHMQAGGRPSAYGETSQFSNYAALQQQPPPQLMQQNYGDGPGLVPPNSAPPHAHSPGGQWHFGQGWDSALSVGGDSGGDHRHASIGAATRDRNRAVFEQTGYQQSQGFYLHGGMQWSAQQHGERIVPGNVASTGARLLDEAVAARQPTALTADSSELHQTPQPLPKPGYRFSDAVSNNLPQQVKKLLQQQTSTKNEKHANKGTVDSVGNGDGGEVVTNLGAARLTFDAVTKAEEIDGKGDGRHAEDVSPPIHNRPRVAGDFQKITGKKAKRHSTSGASLKHQSQQQQPMPASVQYHPENVTPPSGTGDGESHRATRFQILSAVPAAQFVDEKRDNRKNADDLDGGHKMTTLKQRGCQQQMPSGNRKRDSSDVGDRQGKAKAQNQRRKGRKQEPWWPIVLINMVLMTLLEYVRRGCRWLYDLITDILAQLWDIFVYISTETYQKCRMNIERLRYCIGERIRSTVTSIRHGGGGGWWFGRSNATSQQVKGAKQLSWGLTDNIQLPTTGDEAMRRLLQTTRGEDAYSVLGLKADCTDDEIKRYYKRQAVLVHPDKVSDAADVLSRSKETFRLNFQNNAYGADEAFKVLAQAFELIGTPERRQTYNRENLHRNPAMQELDKLMEKLRQKMEEALSTMHCDCGGRHRRFKTERPLSEARYCRKCKEYHPSRENDIWAESKWWGLVWCYYACMDQAVFDITQWAACSRSTQFQKNLLKHIKANSHAVQYRLISSGTTGGQPMGGGQSTTTTNQQRVGNTSNQQSSSSRYSQANAASRNRAPSDSELESLLSRFLTNSGGAASTSGGADEQPTAGGEAYASSYRPPDRPSTGPGGMLRKAGRRRKK